MFKRNRKRPARWVGPLFAFEAIMVTFAAKREAEQASARQAAEVQS